MKPTHMLRVALEGEEALADEQKKADAEETTPTAPPNPETQAPAPAPEGSEKTDPQAPEASEATPAEEAPKGEGENPEAAPEPAAPAAPATEPGAPSEAAPESEPEQKKLKKEDELVFYGKIVDFSELKSKSAEYQEQYEVKIPKTDKNACPGRIRVRKTVKGDKEPRFVLTTKTKLPDGSEFESDCKTTEENFIQFKYFAEGGMIKDRYSFPVEGYKGLKWEIDVFTGTNGLMHEWCKIDLEREDSGIQLVNLPPFPIQLTDVISNQNGSRTAEEEAIVRTLYDTVFRTPNPIISGKKEKDEA